jgi:hypothetical protein
MALTDLKDHIDLEPTEPCVFFTYEGKGWYEEPVGRLIRQEGTLKFDCYDFSTDKIDSFVEMKLEADGLFHWRESGGKGHWWGFLSNTETHRYLTGNFINDDGMQGVQIFMWPQVSSM